MLTWENTQPRAGAGAEPGDQDYPPARSADTEGGFLYRDSVVYVVCIVPGFPKTDARYTSSTMDLDSCVYAGERLPGSPSKIARLPTTMPGVHALIRRRMELIVARPAARDRNGMARLARRLAGSRLLSALSVAYHSSVVCHEHCTAASDALSCLVLVVGYLSADRVVLRREGSALTRAERHVGVVVR